MIVDLFIADACCPCPVVAPGRQNRQVIAGARQVSLVSGHSVYAMDDHSRFSKYQIALYKWFT